MDPKSTQLTSRGKFLQYSVFETGSGMTGKLFQATDSRIEKGEIASVDTQRNAFAFGTAGSAIFLTFTRGKSFIGNTDGINLTVAQKAIIRESSAILVGGNKTAVEYISGLTSAGVVPFYPKYQMTGGEPVFNLCFTEGTRIIFDWTT